MLSSADGKNLQAKKPRKSIKNKKIENWQIVIDHINGTWKHTKGVDYNYPWRGKDIADLAHHARNYQPWGVMALWDVYLENADEWVVKHGYGLDGFFRALPWLVDRSWKGLAQTYKKRYWPPQLVPEMKQAMSLFDGKFHTKKHPQKTSRFEWLQRNAQKKQRPLNEKR